MTNITSHLLERAYELAEKKKFKNTKFILDSIIYIDANNVEAWHLYLQLCVDQDEREWLANKISSSIKITPKNKIRILDYFQYLNRETEPEFLGSEPINNLYSKSAKKLTKITLFLIAIAVLLIKLNINDGLIIFIILLEISYLILIWQNPTDNSKHPNFLTHAMEIDVVFDQEDYEIKY
ncbi:MAG: hypothetical protein QGD88_04750 [Anaerolineae bacterium]|nr:hypothetical protein [Anaerolineae bacterium]